MKKLFMTAVALMALTGCTTLNKNECKNADWEMIGLEDGSQGRPTSYISKHRSACAKFNITPDLEEYNMGRMEGLEQYCTPAQGLRLGTDGSQYHGVCPPQLEGPFLERYNLGRELYLKLSQAEKMSSQITSYKSQIEKLTDELDDKKEQLISSGTSEGDRAVLLREIENLQNKITDLEKKIVRQKSSKKQLEKEAEELRESF